VRAGAAGAAGAGGRGMRDDAGMAELLDDAEVVGAVFGPILQSFQSFQSLQCFGVYRVRWSSLRRNVVGKSAFLSEFSNDDHRANDDHGFQGLFD